jgi:hypothetical protein
VNHPACAPMNLGCQRPSRPRSPAVPRSPRGRRTTRDHRPRPAPGSYTPSHTSEKPSTRPGTGRQGRRDGVTGASRWVPSRVTADAERRARRRARRRTRPASRPPLEAPRTRGRTGCPTHPQRCRTTYRRARSRPRLPTAPSRIGRCISSPTGGNVEEEPEGVCRPASMTQEETGMYDLHDPALDALIEDAYEDAVRRFGRK